MFRKLCFCTYKSLCGGVPQVVLSCTQNHPCESNPQVVLLCTRKTKLCPDRGARGNATELRFFPLVARNSLKIKSAQRADVIVLQLHLAQCADFEVCL
jgi:hypothetical protein